MKNRLFLVFFVFSLLFLLVCCSDSCFHKNIHYYLIPRANGDGYFFSSKCCSCGKILIRRVPFETGFPIVFIDTDGQGISSKETYIEALMKIADTDGSEEEFSVKIKGRGNATWTGYPKKAYKIKFENKTSVIGMPKDKSWDFFANYCDKTLLRTSIGWKVSELLEMEYTPKYRYVELVLDGEYVGNYQLTETVKKGKNRIPIEDDGFVIENLMYDDEDVKFYSGRNYLFHFKEPDSEDVTQTQIKYAKSQIDSLETILFSDDNVAFDPQTGYQKYIDIESWAKWFLVQNVIQNLDMNYYFYKKNSENDTKLCIGPVWDFEYSLGIGWYYGERPLKSHDFNFNIRKLENCCEYFLRLMEDDNFKREVKSLWDKYGATIMVDLPIFFDETRSLVYKSQKFNFYKWNILNKQVGRGGIPLGTYDAEADCDRAFLVAHLQWLDETISSWSY